MTMLSRARRLVARIALVQAGVPLLSTALTLVLAPRALLLDPTDLSLAVGSWALLALLIAVIQAVITAIVLAPLMTTLEALFAAERDVSPNGSPGSTRCRPSW
ncbi:MAG: hypothetical protein U0235_05615 [Polyangiaceae bacterium]